MNFFHLKSRLVGESLRNVNLLFEDLLGDNLIVLNQKLKIVNLFEDLSSGLKQMFRR